MASKSNSTTTTVSVSNSKCPEVVKMLSSGEPRYFIRVYDGVGKTQLLELDKPTTGEEPVNKYLQPTEQPRKDEEDEEAVLDEIKGKTWPLATHISDELVKTIVNNDYIEFETLLEDKKFLRN